jgi:predicted TIM-barrel fold metal-dependent hydrolase
MSDEVAETVARMGTMVDANLHLWDQAENPVFWLSDRTLVVDMLGDYSSLPDRFTLDDYRRVTAPFDIGNVIWSDPGTADPVAAIDWLRQQDAEGLVAAVVTLGDPLAAGFGDFVERVAADELVTSVRVRLVTALQDDAPSDSGRRVVSDQSLVDALRLLVRPGLVATIEASADQLERIATLLAELPELRIVVDHFGWRSDLSAQGRRIHLERLRPLAAHANVATRLDALGTIFGAWDVETVRPWLEGAVDLFGCDRCMFGSDWPIESLRSSFAGLCRAYDEIFRSRTPEERRQLFQDSALRWLGARTPG